MHQFQSFPFPVGSTVDQVKRDAKRLRSEKSVKLSTALDSLGCAALGLPDGTLRWSQVVRVHSIAAEYCKSTRRTKSVTFPHDSIDAFKSGVVALYDIKDGLSIENPGEWTRDHSLDLLMMPPMIALSVLCVAQEDGRNSPNSHDFSLYEDDLATDCEMI